MKRLIEWTTTDTGLQTLGLLTVLLIVSLGISLAQISGQAAEVASACGLR